MAPLLYGAAAASYEGLLQAQTCLAIALGPVEQFQCWMEPECFVLDLDFVRSLLCVTTCVFFSRNLREQITPTTLLLATMDLKT
jgi:hypothetical protein